jgi:hypothetical protein
MCLFPCRLNDSGMLSKDFEGMQRCNGLAVRLNSRLKISVVKIIKRLLIGNLGRYNG